MILHPVEIKLQAFLEKNLPQSGTQSPLLVAYSGGLDSQVLLHALVKLAQFPCKAIHVNHNLSEHAKAWEKFAAENCRLLGVELLICHVDASPINGASREAAAREARYQAFKENIQPQQGLLTAHHQDDQAETVLLQLFRGAGSQGLAAMPAKKHFQNGFIFRPFLDLARSDLFAYAMSNGLGWIEDASNQDLTLERNYIRHELLPLIQQRYPSIKKNLSRTAINCQDFMQLTQETAEQDLKLVQGEERNTVQIKLLMQLSIPRRNNVLRFWLQKLNLPLPSRVKLQQLETNLLTARIDKQPEINWNGVTVRRYRNLLFAFAPKEINSSKIDIRFKKVLQGGFKIPADAKVEIHYRQGGEVLTPINRAGRHSLKKLFQEWGVPPWERDKVPLIFINNELAAVANYCVCEPYAAKAGEEGFLIDDSY